METRAQLNGVRLAPRKVRAVTHLMKHKDALVVLDQLENVIRRPSPILIKLLKSALANAEQNFHMVKENLYVKEVIVNEGMKLKRYMPRARGQANEIQKKTSRITIVLSERVPGMKKTQKEISVKEPAKHEHHEHKETAETKTTGRTEAKPEIKRELGKKGTIASGLRKIFQRKAI